MKRTILGIDPGTTIIGFGVVVYERNAFTPITYGVIRNVGVDHGQDLVSTAHEVTKLIEAHHPDMFAIERLFFTKNQKTAMKVSEMRGVLLMTAAQHQLPIVEFTPLQVKQSIAGYGGADKKQVEKMVRMLLKIPTPITPDDAADALAIAMCGAVHDVP